MKKQNIITMGVLVGIIAVIGLYILITGQTTLNPNTNQNGGNTEQNSEVDNTEDVEDTEDAIQNTESVESTENTETTEETESESETESEKPMNITASMDTALFIGDSRTVGLQAYTKEYTGTADFFAAVSTTVTGVVNYNAKAEVEGLGEITITELLSQRSYDKVYIMLGINEASDYPSNIAKNTQKLIDIVQTYQPDAVVFIMANFYVSESYSSSRPAFSTENMKAINDAQGALANGEDIFYIDANPLFVDENGNLSSEFSGDGCHLRAKSCKTWAQWIIEQTKECLGL